MEQHDEPKRTYVEPNVSIRLPDGTTPPKPDQQNVIYACGTVDPPPPVTTVSAVIVCVKPGNNDPHPHSYIGLAVDGTKYPAAMYDPNQDKWCFAFTLDPSDSGIDLVIEVRATADGGGTMGKSRVFRAGFSRAH